MIPLERFVDGRAVSPPKLSPDGKRIAYFGADDGAQSVSVAPSDDVKAARPVARYAVASVRDLWWAHTNAHVLLLRDAAGSEQTRIESVEVATGKATSLSPGPAGETRLVALSATRPDEVLVESNARDPAFFDLYRVNVATGASEMTVRNERFTWIYADHFLQPRLAEERLDDGAVTYHAMDADQRWRALLTVPAEDEMLTRPFRIFETTTAFNADASELYAMDSRGRDTAALAAWNLATGQARTLLENDKADVVGVVVDQATHEVLACTTEYQRPAIHFLQGSAAEELKTCGASDGDIAAVTHAAGDRWIVSVSAPDRPTRYWSLDRAAPRCTPLYMDRPDLDSVTLAAMSSHIVLARDDLPLVCYLTRPAADASSGLVVLVHGGPWQRDSYAFDAWTQFLASRGYAVLSVNFRGSRGFGKAFLNAGDRQWGGRIVDDVIDATTDCTRRGVARTGKIALMGASFGGFATLMGLARAPELFCCGVDIFGVTNLESFLGTIPPHWKALAAMWSQRVGEARTEEGRRQLARQSPLHNVQRIRVPLLVAQGDNDPRVVRGESDQMVAALKAQGTEVTYLRYPDEGHGFFHVRNQLGFLAAVEAFLAKHLGGKESHVQS